MAGPSIIERLVDPLGVGRLLTGHGLEDNLSIALTGKTIQHNIDDVVDAQAARAQSRIIDKLTKPNYSSTMIDGRRVKTVETKTLGQGTGEFLPCDGLKAPPEPGKGAWASDKRSKKAKLEDILDKRLPSLVEQYAHTLKKEGDQGTITITDSKLGPWMVDFDKATVVKGAEARVGEVPGISLTSAQLFDALDGAISHRDAVGGDSLLLGLLKASAPPSFDNGDKNSVQQLFERIVPHALRGSAREIYGEVRKVYKLVLLDEDNRIDKDGGVYTLDFNAPGALVTDIDGPADCTLVMTAKDFGRMAKGLLKPQDMMLGGQMVVAGDVEDAAALQPAFIAVAEKFMDEIAQMFAKSSGFLQPPPNIPAENALEPPSGQKTTIELNPKR